MTIPDTVLTGGDGLQINRDAEGIALTWRAGAQPGRFDLTARGPDGQDSAVLTRIPRADGSPEMLVSPAVLPVLAVDSAAPEGRIGVISGSDRVALWLRRLGADVTELADPAATDLSEFDTILLGVMAMARGDVDAAALRSFVEGGGNLVSLYQRPDRGWDAATSGPRPLWVGTPSLRWRVTDPEAEVTLLQPDHPLFAGPNRIGPEDWQGWVKERGLYFAADWDPVYQPLIALSDRGEVPLQGALLSGRIGRGRHTHCALSLPVQLDRLVPGAFRLLVNLVAPVPG